MKGEKLERITVACEECGAEFDRSIAHPYLKKCPACRKRAGRAASGKALPLHGKVPSLSPEGPDGEKAVSRKKRTRIPKTYKEKNPLAVFNKGGPAPRETVPCATCGKGFERSVYHTYIDTCPDCRKAAKKERAKAVKCPACREILEQPGKLGMKVCPKCKKHWWSMGDAAPEVFIDKTSYDDLVYRSGKLRGPFHEAWPQIVADYGINRADA